MYCLILSTASSLKEARTLAQILLRKKLAACVSLLNPIESHYSWKGKREKNREVLLLIKTRKALFSKVQTALRRHHSYSVPEILQIPIQKGSSDYLAWLRQETKIQD